MAPVIPEKFEGFTHAAGFAHMRCYKPYKTIFGDSFTPGLIETLDTVLTSTGGFGEHYHAFRNDVIEDPGFTRERLGEFAEGDIAGVLIGKDGLTKTQAKDLDTIRKLWTGIRIEQLRQISANARNNGHPGVILCAIGASKADIVLAAIIREKLVNHLFIDETLAARLQELLKLPTVAAA
jgi:DNA-binding transcriptional regulator LsrR (DeoR family)